MKKLKMLALAFAAFTAIVVFAGFTTAKKAPGAVNDPVFEELKDNRPFVIRCLEVIDDKIRVVAVATGCTPMEKSNCVLTTCPDKAGDKDMKVLLFKCVNAAGRTVAYANGCMTATDAYCTPGTCPPGTSATT